MPFFQSVFEPKFARNLLINRHKQLPQAIENGIRLGFADGAALYPAATVNGEECHPEPDISLETLHRNASVAFAIFDYVRYSGDQDFLADYGLEMLIGIARFWSQRVHWSQRQQQYLLHGVTGPNEYERNVNNNGYTNRMAAWCLEYTLEALKIVESVARENCAALLKRLNYQGSTETARWADIAAKIYLPTDEELGIFEQQDGYLAKEQLTVADLGEDDKPLHRHWSWDRILRSSFLRQADVLQAPFFLDGEFSESDLRRNFEFYEPRTVHEGSVSAAVHSLLAARLGKKDIALDLLLRSAHQDLNGENADTTEGLHLSAMAGTWLAIVKGFGGMKVEPNMLSFSPWLPTGWEAYAFKVCWRGHVIELKMTAAGASISNHTGKSLKVKLNGTVLEV
ncbi:MAG: hypothetical protein IPM82_13070 [Saprospiraceae bacterium]|nr:hypothetical protein [Saprospiraceae bacterium]